MNDGDVIEMRVSGIMDEQRCENIFHYILDDPGVESNPTLEDFVEAWRDLVLAAIRAIQISNYVYRQIRAVNLVSASAPFTLDISDLAGSVTSGTHQATFDAFGFKLTPTLGITRPGSKRFAGVYEEVLSSGGVLTVGSTPLNNINTALASAILMDGTPNLVANAQAASDEVLMRPIVLGRDGNGDYELGRIDFIAAASMNTRKTTQNTRKIGRGN